MDRGLRAAYLETLGIDVWVPRAGVGGSESAAVASRPAEPAPADEPISGAARLAAVRPAGAQPTGMQGAAALLAAPGDDSEWGGQWGALREEVVRCTRCSLHAGRTQGVFGVGNPRAEWMVIGEAPGAEEDRRGEPFVGRAGQLLDAMLRALGLSRTQNVYIANVLKSRPPNNRDPRPEEVGACLPYLRRQIELVRPRLLLAVGRIAAQNLLGTEESLSRLRGRVHRFGELNTPLVVTYHPAYLLRNPADKRKAWEDLKFARSVFRQLTAGSEDGHRS
jgi:uracil-DNA glycosylase family 4